MKIRPQIDIDKIKHQIKLYEDCLRVSVNDVIEYRALGKNKPPIKFNNTKASYPEFICDLVKRGYEEFAQINQSDGNGQKAENISGVRCLVIDLDDAVKAQAVIDNLPLTPSMVVNSSRGKFHIYYKVHDCSLNLFKPIQKALAKHTGGDEAICDLPRIMRLPGSCQFAP